MPSDIFFKQTEFRGRLEIHKFAKLVPAKISSAKIFFLLLFIGIDLRFSLLILKQI